MTKFPDFTKLDLDALAPSSAAARPRTLATPEGINLATAYSAADTKGLDFLDDEFGVLGDAVACGFLKGEVQDGGNDLPEFSHFEGDPVDRTQAILQGDVVYLSNQALGY